LGAATPAAASPAAATPAAAAGGAPFSADNIASILGNIPAAPAAPAAGGAAAGGFSADAISNILGNLQAGAPAGPPLALNDVLAADSAAPAVDAAMEVALHEHLPQGGSIPESAAETLSTPQMAQAAARFTEALYRGEAAGLITEMNLNPTGLGVEPFLIALQASADAANASAGAAEPMETETKPAGAKAEDKMDES